MENIRSSQLLAIRIALSALLFIKFASAFADCNCGPTYCVDTPEYGQALSNKKAAAEADGAPDRLIALYDTLDHCAASVTTSPDGFRILRRTPEGDIFDDEWTAENEHNDAKLLADGKLSACYVMLSRHAFACCGRPEFNKRPDYDPQLDLNKSGALPCS